MCGVAKARNMTAPALDPRHKCAIPMRGLATECTLSHHRAVLRK